MQSASDTIDSSEHFLNLPWIEKNYVWIKWSMNWRNDFWFEIQFSLSLFTAAIQRNTLLYINTVRYIIWVNCLSSTTFPTFGYMNDSSKQSQDSRVLIFELLITHAYTTIGTQLQALVVKYKSKNFKLWLTDYLLVLVVFWFSSIIMINFQTISQ